MIRKLLVSVLAISLMIPTIGASAKVNELKSNEKVSYWAEKFPSFNETLENGNITKLVGTDEIYVKFTPKESVNSNILINGRTVYAEEDFESEVFTKEEYEDYILNSINTINTRTIGPFEPDGGSNPRWLNLDLQVYETSTYGEYMAVSFWEWKTIPAFYFKDVNGINTSSEFIIGLPKAMNPKVAEYRTIDINGKMEVAKPPIYSAETGNGLAAEFKLREGFASSTTNPLIEKHMGMLQTPVEFSNSSGKKGRIYTSYVHKQVGIGGLSFDSTGAPSFGPVMKVNKHAGSVYVSR